MKYTVLKIEEDLDFGCEERKDGTPVMAVVTLLDESGEQTVLRQEDRKLYERGIWEKDQVYLDKEMELQKADQEQKEEPADRDANRWAYSK